MTYQEWAKAVAEADQAIDAARTKYIVDCLRVADSATFEASRLVQAPELDSNFVGALQFCVAEAAQSGHKLRELWLAKAALLVTEHDEPDLLPAPIPERHHEPDLGYETAVALAELNAIKVPR